MENKNANKLTQNGKDKIAIFVHGCFWHQHSNCKIANKPKSNTKFWRDKFKKNKDRDSRNINDLKINGWKPIVIWECEILDVNRKVKDLQTLLSRIKKLKK